MPSPGKEYLASRKSLVESALLIPWFVAEYQNGISINKLSNKSGVSSTFIRNHLLKEGVSLRSGPAGIRLHHKPTSEKRDALAREGKKYCVRCSSIKLMEEFADRVKSTDGKSYSCRECKSQYHTIKTYGIDKLEYAKMVLQQHGTCGICGINKCYNRAWSVDHDHNTGEVRGLLCHKCNLMLGYAKDDIKILEAGIKYLTEPPARIVNLKMESI